MATEGRGSRVKCRETSFEGEGFVKNSSCMMVVNRKPNKNEVGMEWEKNENNIKVPTEQAWRLNKESTQEHYPSSHDTAWIRWMNEGKRRYQDFEFRGPGFPTHHFFIRTLKKIGKLIHTLSSQKLIPHRCTWILTFYSLGHCTCRQLKLKHYITNIKPCLHFTSLKQNIILSLNSIPIP